MQQIPDFFVVGQPKTGSTSLYLMLREHPNIYMSVPKEPSFFAPPSPLHSAVEWGPPGEPTLEDYLELFSGAGEDQVAGEASVDYLRSHVAARGIAQFNPQARIIAILREPAGLLRSWHAMRVRLGDERGLDLRVLLDREDAYRRSASPDVAQLLYTEQVRYTEQLERFRAVFPAEQMLILLYDDYVADNARTLRQIQQFLGLGVDWIPSHQVANRSQAVRFPRTMSSLNRLSHGRGQFYGTGKRLIRTLVGPHRSRRLLAAAQRQLTVDLIPPDAELDAELREKYAPEVYRLSEYLGRDLTALWGAGVDPRTR